MELMSVIVIFLVVLALVLFLLAARTVLSPSWRLGWAGLACLTLALLLSDVVFAVDVR